LFAERVPEVRQIAVRVEFERVDRHVGEIPSLKA
jgi:hypothetical protein